MILALAPMACLTHLAFRSVVSRFAMPHFFYSEMIHSPSLLAGGKFERYYMLTTKDEPLIWQLTSNESDSIKDGVAWGVVLTWDAQLQIFLKQERVLLG